MTTVGDLPLMSGDEMNTGEAAARGDHCGDSGDERLSDDGLYCGDDDPEGSKAKAARRCATLKSFLCTFVSAMRLGNGFFLEHPVFKTRSPEATFAQGFRDAVPRSELNALPDDRILPRLEDPFLSKDWESGASTKCATEQAEFFQKFDAHIEEHKISGLGGGSYTKQFQAQVSRVQNTFMVIECTASMQAKTTTVVLETAMWLLQDGDVNVRG